VRSPRSLRPFRRDRIVAGLLAAALAVAVPVVEHQAPAGAAPPEFSRAAWNRTIGPTHLSSPVVADVNRDGHADVVTADLSGWVHVLDGRNGNDLRGWPRAVQVNPGQTVAVESTPTVADLDGDGRKEIIVGAGSLERRGQQGGVVVFRGNGTVRWRVRTMTVENQSGVISTPAVGDVNGDGRREVVFGSWDHRLYVVDRSGHALPGFPMDTLDTIWSSPALYDVGSIGRMDIFIGGDASPGGPCGSWSWAGILRRIRVTAAGPVVKWSRCQHQIFQSSPAIGDIGSDGRMEIVIGTGTGPSGDARATNTLKAFHLNDGSRVPGWPVTLNGAIFGTPVIGDVNGDRKRDVVVTACARCNRGQVWAFGGRGKLLWSVTPGASQGAFTEILSTPILVDLDGKGANDIAVGQAGQFYFLHGRDGRRLYRPIEVNRVTQNSAAVANFGRGSGWRLVTQTWRPQGTGRPMEGVGKVSVYRLPKPPLRTPSWPQWRQNANHTASPTPRVSEKGI
jgi:outer membrane protein assembly factor BamB